jgi:aspartyl-tRNA(Asn)/glutamyl-tRNA(Gln) amidotransferase subunit C
MKINVPHVAKLANLTLTSDEITRFESQLIHILEYVKKLEEVDTTAIEPTSQVTGLENITRLDNTIPSLTQQEALTNAKAQKNGQFQVKGILESE